MKLDADYLFSLLVTDAGRIIVNTHVDLSREEARSLGRALIEAADSANAEQPQPVRESEKSADTK